MHLGILQVGKGLYIGLIGNKILLVNAFLAFVHPYICVN